MYFSNHMAKCVSFQKITNFILNKFTKIMNAKGKINNF